MAAPLRRDREARLREDLGRVLVLEIGSDLDDAVGRLRRIAGTRPGTERGRERVAVMALRARIDRPFKAECLRPDAPGLAGPVLTALPAVQPDERVRVDLAVRERER